MIFDFWSPWSLYGHPKEGEAFRGILYPKYLEMETFFLTLEHILRIQKKNFFGSDPRVETSEGNFVIFEALFWASLGQPVDVLEFWKLFL